MTRAEFEELAGIQKSKFFSLLEDPVVRTALDYRAGLGGRADMDRASALAFIRNLRQSAKRRMQQRTARLGAYATTQAPPRGRPCPHCRRRITRKACTCRHCNLPVAAA